MEEHTTLNHNTEQAVRIRESGGSGSGTGEKEPQNSMATKWPLQVAGSCGWIWM